MSTLAPVSVALEVTEAVLELSTAEVAQELSAALTRPIVASIMGVSATKVVAQWEREGAITPQRDRALRLALQLTRIIMTRFAAPVARTWMVGRNSRLEDATPASVIRAAAVGVEDDAMERRVLNAARSFVTR